MRPVQILISDCANAQADLNFRWVCMSECMFSKAVTHLIVQNISTKNEVSICECAFVVHVQ